MREVTVVQLDTFDHLRFGVGWRLLGAFLNLFQGQIAASLLLAASARGSSEALEIMPHSFVLGLSDVVLS